MAQNTQTLHLMADLSGPHDNTMQGADRTHPLFKLAGKNNRWTLVVVEEHTHLLYVTSFDNKGDAKKHLKKAISWMRQHLKKTVAEVIVDNGSEFKGTDAGDSMEDYYDNLGIHCRTTLAHEKVKNSLAERMIGVINTRARVLLHRARLPTWMHAHATSYVSHMLNHTARPACGGVAPITYARNASGAEAQTELIMFGERVSVLNVNDQDRASTYAPVATHGIYLGIDKQTGEHMVVIPATTEQERPYFTTTKNMRRTNAYYYTHYAHEQAYQRQLARPTAPAASSAPAATPRRHTPAPPNASNSAWWRLRYPIQPGTDASPSPTDSSPTDASYNDDEDDDMPSTARPTPPDATLQSKKGGKGSSNGSADNNAHNASSATPSPLTPRVFRRAGPLSPVPEEHTPASNTSQTALYRCRSLPTHLPGRWRGD